MRKTFRIPVQKVDSLKERMVHPFARPDVRLLEALRDVSFDVRRGEFFGIVGRNGSGKSTLLKILASIYRADAGTIRIAGQPAPFIELGVGFNPDLTARENVVLNGVMMGLSRREAARRFDAVLDFAELHDFADLKLKNYSSGMMVRLAFSVMIQAESEILLIDEVLAVGDAAFAQKCADVFRQMRRAGRTIVLVTHDMAAVESYCHRAMLIDGGDITTMGEPEEVAREYLRLNFQGPGAEGEERPAVPDRQARLVEVWLEDEHGERIGNVEKGAEIRFGAVIEARVPMDSPGFVFNLDDENGVHLFTVGGTYSPGDGHPNRLEAGEKALIRGAVENPLNPGRYFVNCVVTRRGERGQLAVQVLDFIDFVVYGAGGAGVLTIPGRVEATRFEDPE